MRSRRFLLLPATLSALGLTLAACATSPGRMAVDLQAFKECQRLEMPLKAPNINPDTDYRDLSSESLGAIAKARQAQAARSACENTVIEKYKDAK